MRFAGNSLCAKCYKKDPDLWLKNFRKRLAFMTRVCYTVTVEREKEEENMENTATMTNAELLETFYGEALALGVAIGSHNSVMDTVSNIQELWAEVSKRFIKPQETAR